MKIQIIGAFIKWAISKMLGGVLTNISKANTNFKSFLRTESFMGFVLWILLTVLVTVISAIICGVAFRNFDLALLIPVASLFYFVYTVFSIAWQAFKKDRQQLFETLKTTMKE